MASYIRSDLDFILAQIKIAEENAAGRPLYGNGVDGIAGTADDGLVPSYLLSFGLRTVDGSFNNLLPGQEYWGSSNQPFVELMTPEYRPADGTLFDPDGPGPAPATPTSPNYNPSNNPNSLVFDSSLRTISNLIVDQSLVNPAAVLKALQTGGVAAADLTNLGAVLAIYDAYKPFSDAEYQARVIANNDLAAANALSDGNPLTPPSPAEQAALDTAALSTATHNTTVDAMEAARIPRDAALATFGIEMDGDNVSIPNVATDAVSAPFNSWFTLFGQFFDHGLDLVNKGGSGTVFVPLQPDDPLYVPGSNTNFMVLTRATTTPGLDGIMGTADDVRPVNTTTPFVDQNQTYTSHPSHQVFLREYVINSAGKPVATGNLIEGRDASGGTTGVGHGGMATWGEVKAQTLQMLGIQLVDQDVGKVPLILTDAYGNFIPHPVTGFAQVVIGLGNDGIPNTADDIVVSGTPGAPILLATAGGVGAIRTNSAFLADIAHTAVPNGIEDGDITIGLENPGNNPAVYDNELLDAHFIAGDGRANENIGLTAVHSIFHSEHNRLAAHTKGVILADAASMIAGGSTQAQAVAFLNEWLANDVVAVPVGQAAIDGLVWDGNRIFQAAKFGTEMQYQHLVFEDFARKIQPNIDFFVVPDGYHADINPSITAEFAHVVYRFGHSMLTETIDRFDTSFNANQIGLVEAFLNPVAFDANHTIADGIAAGDIIRGMTRQVGNEIDEFVTGALRNNLLGLPLDLATINLARGRDTGVPSLNAARREFYEVSNQAPELKPYESWIDFAANLKNEASIINFVAAYGTHGSITSQSSIDGKRDAAMTLIFNQSFGGLAVPPDRDDFLNGEGAWANVGGKSTTGLEVVDLWIGGLAEKTMVGGGMLGATFNFVFEVQMEKLQDGDRFYYLQRLDGLHFLAEMENNTFAKVISLNSNVDHLPSDVFSTPGLILEVNQARQYNDLDGDGDLESGDPTGGSILTPLVIRNNPATVGSDSNYLKYTGAEHVILGGTSGNDILIASEGDDTLYGDAGNDRLEGGQGNDSYIGGDGDDIITDLFGDDIIRSGAGNDAINAGVGTDLVIADEGHDFVVLGSDVLDETFLGLGNDYVLGSKTTEQSMGGEGNDWIEVGAWTGAVGDNFDDQFAADSVRGHDVFSGDGGFDEFIGEGGDDIWNGTLGRGKFDGMSGFDWATYKDYKFGVNADLTRQFFDALPLPPPNSALDVYTFVEAVSGSAFNDEILGSDFTAAEIMQQGARGSVLENDGIALIQGLQDVLGAGVTSFSAGNILLGGAGSDVITGRGGDDIIDGDKWLNVRIGVHASVGVDGGVGAEIDSANSMSELVTEIFNGTYNPGQLRIHREILDSGGAGDIDTAVYSGNRADYTTTLNGNGTITIAHTNVVGLDDGVDTVSNVEQFRFADGTFTAAQLFNFAPVITSNGGGATAAVNVAENIAAVTTVAATDANGDALIYSISTTVAADNADRALFTINAATGALSFVGAPNFEAPTDIGVNNLYNVVVQVTDGIAIDTQALAVTVTNVNEVATGALRISGYTTTANNATLTATNTLADPDGMTNVVQYQWQRLVGNVWTNIAGATTATLASQANTTVRVTSSYTDPFEPALVVSAETAFIGTNQANTITGSAGIDIVLGLDGADTLTGSAGIDTVDGGNGNDVFVATVNDGNDSYIGGAGVDTYNLSGTTAAATINLTTGLSSSAQTGNDTLAGIENIIGTAGVNTITDGIGSNQLDGMGGNDTFTMTVDNARDAVIGGAGSDTVNYSAFTAALNVTLNGNTNATVTGTGTGANTDQIRGIENFIGGSGNDTITGDNNANALSGGVGVDRLTGGTGKDTLTGGAGVDTFDFNSTIILGFNTSFDSGIGAANRDVISDFVHLTDKIDVSSIDAINSLFGANQAFTWLGNAAFTGANANGGLRYFFDGANTIVEGSTNNGTGAEFQIELTGNVTLTAADFVL